MQMQHSSALSQRRGAVNVMWLVTFVILFLGMTTLWILQMGDLEKARAATSAAQAAERVASERENSLLGDIQDHVEVLGFAPEAGGINADLPRAWETLAGYMQLHPELNLADVDVNDPTGSYEAVVAKVIAEWQKRGTLIAGLEQQVKDRDSTIKSLNTKINEDARKAAEAKSGVDQALADAESNASEVQQDLQGRLDNAVKGRNDKDAELRVATGSIASLEDRLETEKRQAETRVKQITEKLKFLREPEAVDGEFLAVSQVLNNDEYRPGAGVGWINRGRVDRVQRGMVFDIVSGRPGATGVKARCVVTSVDNDRSQVDISDLADKYDPVVAGDTIYNRLYDPHGERNAVLIGRFDGDYTEGDIRALCGQIGITVQKAVDDDTDYLIVGSQLYQNEDGELLEEPVQPSELAEYKDADAKGVAIVSIRDVRRFFPR